MVWVSSRSLPSSSTQNGSLLPGGEKEPLFLPCAAQRKPARPSSGTVQIRSQQVRGPEDFDLQETHVAQVLQRAFQTLERGEELR